MYQKHILDLLRRASHLRYSELRPDGVESSHFKYHLDELCRDKIVERTERGVYALTKKGFMTVDRLSVGRINPYLTPKVITYTLLEDADNYYFYRKNKAPFLHTLNMIAGKVHLGESTQEAAIREVREKADLDLVKVRHVAVAEVRIMDDSDLVSHFVAYVYVATVESAHSLVKIPKAELVANNELAPDTRTLIDALQRQEAFISLTISSAR